MCDLIANYGFWNYGYEYFNTPETKDREYLYVAFDGQLPPLWWQSSVCNAINKFRQINSLVGMFISSLLFLTISYGHFKPVWKFL